MELKIEKKDVDIRISRDIPQDMDELLTQIFWKEPKLAPVAREFLEHLKAWGRTDSPYKVDEWKSYCTRKEITQSRYHNMLKRLKNAGMIDKTYNRNQGKHELHLTDKFSQSLTKMARIWDEYCSL